MPARDGPLSKHRRAFAVSAHSHSMGEARRKALAARREAGQGPAEPQVVDTLGGRMHVRWDQGATATPHGQLVFFAEFLAATGVFERWVSSCPLEYRSGNAPDKRDVLGTLMLGLLAGHRRYAHITALRGDAVAAQALGMARIVSEDALRRALERIDQASSAAWLRPSLMHSVREALDRPWVLDIDASVKPLYRRQEGAETGYTSSKPMRPSHVLHTFLVSNLRLVLDVQVSLGLAAHQRPRQRGAGAAAAGRTGAAAACAGARRLPVRQRGHPADAGAAQAATRVAKTLSSLGRPLRRIWTRQRTFASWMRGMKSSCAVVCNESAQGLHRAPRTGECALHASHWKVLA